MAGNIGVYFCFRFSIRTIQKAICCRHANRRRPTRQEAHAAETLHPRRPNGIDALRARGLWEVFRSRDPPKNLSRGKNQFWSVAEDIHMGGLRSLTNHSESGSTTEPAWSASISPPSSPVLHSRRPRGPPRPSRGRNRSPQPAAISTVVMMALRSRMPAIRSALVVTDRDRDLFRVW